MTDYYTQSTPSTSALPSLKDLIPKVTVHSEAGLDEIYIDVSIGWGGVTWKTWRFQLMGKRGKMSIVSRGLLYNSESEPAVQSSASQRLITGAVANSGNDYSMNGGGWQAGTATMTTSYPASYSAAKHQTPGDLEDYGNEGEYNYTTAQQHGGSGTQYPAAQNYGSQAVPRSSNGQDWGGQQGGYAPIDDHRGSGNHREDRTGGGSKKKVSSDRRKKHSGL